MSEPKPAPQDPPNSAVPARRTYHFQDVEQFGGFGISEKLTFIRQYLLTPNLSGVARAMGFSPETIRLASHRDPEFGKAMDEARQELCDGLEARVHEYGQRPQNFMDRIAWLRAYRPGRWAPDKNVNVTVDVKQTETLSTKAGEYIDTTAVDTPSTEMRSTDGPEQGPVPRK